MNRILLETHKKKNINLLRVRDYYFDKARKLNTYRIICVAFPIVLLVASYLPFVNCYDIFDKYRDYYIGILSIFLFFAARKINAEIQKSLIISNVFREEYDINVFNIDRNKYAYDTDIIAQYIDVSNNCTNDSKKYEHWYEEIFTEENKNNVLCCQMDNIIYTYYVYRDTKKIYTIFLMISVLGVALLWFFVAIPSFIFLSIISLFSLFQMFIEYIDVCNELIENNEKIRQKVLFDEEVITDIDLRCIQDSIINNRNRSLFIPKYIRNKYLRDGNPYYEDLNDVRTKMFKDKGASIPSSEEDIEILSSDGEKSMNLKSVHQRLNTMLQDIKIVFDENNIQYTLDGGTLIGAVRDGGHFIFWDDDIDLAIRYEDFEKACKVLEQHLSSKYEFQNYYNEEYFSPRLASLRMREKNEKSVVEEKDSPLFEKYDMRGLFIDFYVYAPILVNVQIDKIFRGLFIHPIHKSIKKTENKWKSNREKYSPVFLKKKKKYMKRVEWYLSHVKCEKYYAYTPNYIENIRKPGPYIKREDLYGEKRNCTFENAEYPIPTNAEIVLASFYGNSWRNSPFVSVDNYRKEYGEKWYGHKKFAVTSMKHISYIDDMK